MQRAVSIGKRKRGAAVVIGSGQVVPLRIIVAFQKIAVVDAVRVLVEKHKNFHRLRNLGDFKELRVFRVVDVEAVGGKVARVADHRVH